MIHDIELAWEITSGCNLRCKHCIVSADDNTVNDVNFDDAIEFLKKLKDHKVSINFTGGEPFFRKDFRKILEYCVNNNIKVQVITNGLLFDDEYYDFIKESGIHLGISVESFNKKHFEEIRGKNTFDKLMNNLENLKSKKIAFDIYTTFNKYNVDEIEEILTYAKRYGSKVHFNDITVDGRAKDNLNILTDNKNIIDKLLDSSDKVFGLDEFGYDDTCWATNDILFISSSGNIYLCTEENRCNQRTRLGNIKSFPIDEYYKKCPTLNYDKEKLKCPYKVYFNDRITYNSNVNNVCAMLPKKKEINKLSDLYSEFDNLLKDITESCKNCNYKDCMGFIWLLNQETKKCDENNITTININDKVDFLYFLEEYEDKDITELDFTNIKYPKCEHRCKNTGMCLIHKLRPLVCHMYPIGLETFNGVDMWVLHDECEFTQRLIKNGELELFIMKVNSIINSVSKELYKEIVEKYKEVDKISLFLNGINSYIIIKEVDDYVKM